MSWIDQLLPASFRGVPFQVHEVSHQAGDTVVIREYPFQDLPTVFRMGEGAEEIKFSAYVIGDDYIEQREALREVLSGEGVLIHPTAGMIRVYVAGRYGIKEAIVEEGGMARFDLTFIRAESRRYPVGVTSTEDEAVDAADEAMDAAEDLFAAEFDLAGVQGWVADAAGGGLLGSIGGVWGQVGGLAGSMSALSSLTSLGSLSSLSSLASFGSLGSLGSLASIGALGSMGSLSSLGSFGNNLIGGYQSLVGNFSSLLSAPVLLAGSIRSLFSMPSDLPTVLASRYQDSFSGLFVMSSVVPRNDFEMSVVPPVGGGLVIYGSGVAPADIVNSPGRQELSRLVSVADRFIETLAVASYVRASAAREFSGESDSVNYDEAMQMRRAVHDQCTRLLVTASEDVAPRAVPTSAWHQAVSALHTAALKDMQTRGRDLVRMTTYTPQAWQPIWYISHRLYGTVRYADEIMALNPHIRHPLLVPPGVELRVLRHD